MMYAIARGENAISDIAAEIADGEAIWKRAPKMLKIADAVCADQRMGKAELMSNRRMLRLVYARNVFYFLCLRLTIRGYSEIGRFVGRHHSTVWHGEGIVLERLPAYLPTLRRIAAVLGHGITDDMLIGRRGNEPIASP
jgi:chromosomal replication initiation ATPase DnaA